MRDYYTSEFALLDHLQNIEIISWIYKTLLIVQLFRIMFYIQACCDYISLLTKMKRIRLFILWTFGLLTILSIVLYRFIYFIFQFLMLSLFNHVDKLYNNTQSQFIFINFITRKCKMNLKTSSSHKFNDIVK